jgi:hypothetical protein
MTGSSVTRENLKPPKWTFTKDIPTENTGGLSSDNLPWAIIERLDYIAELLYILVKDSHGDTEES